MLQRLEMQPASEQGWHKFAVIKHAVHARSSQEGLLKFTTQNATGDSGAHRKPIWLGNSLRLGKCLGGESYTLGLLLQSAAGVCLSPPLRQAMELDGRLFKVYTTFSPAVMILLNCADGELLGGDRWLFQGILAGCR